MNKNEFKSFCKNYFEEKGFKKFKNSYYFIGEMNVSCKISLQKSNFSNNYYVNYDFYLAEYSNYEEIHVVEHSDVDGRLVVMSKKSTIQGKPYITGEIEYEEYSEEELLPFFNQEFEEKISPPIYQGKKYILDNLGKYYYLSLHREETLCKLQSD